jgi:competence protein ComEC
MPNELALLKKIAPLINSTHSKCLELLPKAAKNYASLASLVCGEKLTDETLKENLSKTSIIHIFIVSGSHLIFIDAFFDLLAVPFFIRLFFLSFYSLAVGWQAPVVRALVSLILQGIQKHYSLFFPRDLTTLMSGLCTLALFPEWWKSNSLIMSWCASLALSLPTILRIKESLKSNLLAQASLFLLMTIPLFGFGSLHPLSIIYNLILGNVVAFVLLPLSALTLISTNFVIIFDAILETFKFVLENFSEPITMISHSSFSTPTLWSWVFAWHIFFHFLRIHLYHGKTT